MSNADIIDHYDLSFDPGDKKNGSLYLCFPRGAEHTGARDAIVARLRRANLWSNDELKEVPDEHRDAYKTQLKFVESVSYNEHGHDYLIARFDHEKFPSDAQRFAHWKGLLQGQLGGE